MHRLIAFNAIQTIIDKNNLMEILMDNAYAKMVIMMIIKIIIYVSNVKNFGIFFFFTSLFFLSTICSYNSIDIKVICTKC